MFNKDFMRKLREQKKLSMAQLAELVGCSAAHISHLENGQKEPTGRMLFFLAKSLGCTMDELWIDI